MNLVFSAPEVLTNPAAGGPIPDTRANQYSLALTLYCYLMKTLSPMYVNPDGSPAKNRDEDNGLFFPAGANIPKPLQEVLKQATAYDRDKRYSTNADFVSAMRQVLAP